MFNQNKKPWPYFRVKVSATNNPSEYETIKIQAKNEGMAEFLALRRSSVRKKAGCGKVDNIEVAS